RTPSSPLSREPHPHLAAADADGSDVTTPVIGDRTAARAQTYVWMLTAAMAAAGGLLWVTTLRTWGAVAPPHFPLPLWLQIVVFGIAEACVVHMHFQRHANS